MGNAVFLLLPLFAAQDDASAPRAEPVRLELDADFELELSAYWEPFTDSVYGFGDQVELVQKLAPAEQRAGYQAADFRHILPEKAVRVGDLWAIDAVMLLPFLRQLHPGVTTRLHHGWHGDREIPGHAIPGAWACLRALGPDRAEILFRTHVDFQIAGEDGKGVSWLTPAQFEGRMWIDRKQGVVSSFQLSLPDQAANVDLNISMGSNFSVDIGRIPRMEVLGGEGLPDPAAGTLTEMTDAEAREALVRKFYAFEVLDWFELEPALTLAQESGKPLHVVLLFGSLADESC